MTMVRRSGRGGGIIAGITTAEQWIDVTAARHRTQKVVHGDIQIMHHTDPSRNTPSQGILF
jgi:hypothetical protein